MNLESTAVNRLRYIFWVVPALLFLWRSWGAIQVNRAFVTLNHQPSVFTTDQDPLVLSTIEAQLNTAQQYLGAQASTQRMLAIVQRAQGQNVPAGPTTMDLLWWGEQKEKAGEWYAAAYLYQWATDQQPDLGDSWYHLGRVYEAQGLIDEAITFYQVAAAASNWYTFGPSDVYLALGNLTITVKAKPDIAQDYYVQALKQDRFSSAAAKADTYYQLGELLLLHYSDPLAAIPHYQATLDLTPQNHWAHLRLGYSLYWGMGDLSAAEMEIKNAIRTWPDEKYLQWPYFYLGEIYQDAGLTTEAITAYEQVLQLNPDHASVLERLIVLRSP